MQEKIPYISQSLFNSALKELKNKSQNNESFQIKFGISEDIARELCWKLIDKGFVDLSNDWKLVLRK